jgi:putative ABC transport system permease protein
MDQHLGISVFTQRLSGTLLSLFGLLAMGLASIGVFCVMAYAVSQRTREIGIRMALGARHWDVLGRIPRQGLRLTVWGAGLRLAFAALAAPLLRSQRLQGGPRDLLVYAGVAALLGAVALVACTVPARRAAAVDPTHALRHHEPRR